MVYKVRVRSVSVYTDTRAKHSRLYTLIQNGHSFCKHYLLIFIKQNNIYGVKPDLIAANVASVGSVFNDTRKVKALSLPETIKEKSTFRAKGEPLPFA